MSGKSGKGAARAVPRVYGRLTRHERDTVQRMLERGASCREIARQLGRSPSTVSVEVSSHRFVTAPKPVSVNLIFTSFTNQTRRSRKGGFTACANVFSPIPVTP